MCTMNHENAFSHFHYGEDYMLKERFTALLLSRSLLFPILPWLTPLGCVDCHLLPVPFPLYLIYNSQHFLYFIFAKKSPLKSCHVFTYERHEHLKRSGKSPWLFADVLLFLINRRILIFNPLRTDILNWINVRLLCWLRACVQECLKSC